MAILTSPQSLDRRGSAQASTRGGRRSSLVAEWLGHPMANFYLVLVASLLLLGLGSMMVLSASSVYAYVQFGDAYYFVKRHAVFLIVGGLVAWFMATLKLDRLRVLGWLMALTAFVLQLLTFTALGFSKNGNRNWVEIGFGLGRVQPSEFAKLAIVVWGADVLARKYKLLTQPKHLLVPFVPVSALLIGLVVLGRDLGTATVLGAIVLAVLWFVGAPWRLLAGIVGSVAVVMAGLVAASPYRMGRIMGFLDPQLDPLGVNHQPIRAMFALATGGWWGVGLGASRQKWGGLVESHTDYVLAVIGEELGLVGTLIVLGLMVLLGFAGFRIAMRSRDHFPRFVAAGITSWLMIQALVNIGVVLRLMPVIGVPLPLVSYGGSALLTNLCGIGILLACARQEPSAAAWLERRRAAGRTGVSVVVPTRPVA